MSAFTDTGDQPVQVGFIAAACGVLEKLHIRHAVQLNVMVRPERLAVGARVPEALGRPSRPRKVP